MTVSFRTQVHKSRCTIGVETEMDGLSQILENSFNINRTMQYTSKQKQ